MPEFKIVVRPEQTEGDMACIELLDAPFKGVQFKFGQMEFLGEDTNGNGRLAFDHELIFVPEGVKFNGKNKKKFETMLGEVLKKILEDYVLEHPLADEKLDEVRDADTE